MYTRFGGTILVPMQVVKLKFSEREDVALNPFQNLILEAVEDGCSVEQIVQATLLTKYVIQTEIAHLIAQKLLERQGETVELSELSRKLLLVSRCVQRLNEEKKLVCINLMTGSVEKYDKDHFIEGGSKNALELQPRVRRQEIDGISIEENIEFFRTYLRTFDGMEEQKIDTVLSSVYVEFNDTGVKMFLAQPVFQIPCLMGEVEKGKNREESGTVLWARGHMCRIEFSLKSALSEVDDSLLPCLPPLANAGLLSERGLKVATAFAACQKGEPMVGYYDYTSGRLQFSKPHCNSGKHRIDLELPLLYKLTEDDRKKFAEAGHDYFKLPPELILEARNTEDSTYIINGDLNELREMDHA